MAFYLGPKAHFTVVGRELRTAIEGLDYVAYVDVTVKNVTGEVVQGSM